MKFIMPHYNRILVRYCLSQSIDQWSELQWCDIEKNTENHSIEVRVAPAQNEVMPEDTSFTALSEKCAKKLLVWDVADEGNNAYCLVIRAGALCRFNFDLSTKLLVNGQYWSFENNDYDKNKPVLLMRETFNETDIQDDQRLVMKASDYNHEQLEAKAEKLPALKLQYTAWQKKIIQDRERKSAEQEQQKKLDEERRLEAVETNCKQEKAPAEGVSERQPDDVRSESLLPSNDPYEIKNAYFRLWLHLQNEEFRNFQLAASRQNVFINPPAHGSYPAFFPPHDAANPRPRSPRPDLKHVILALMGAALIGFGLYAYTSPWIGIGVIGLAALCVCAAVLGRRRFPGAAELPQLPAIFGYPMGRMS